MPAPQLTVLYSAQVLECSVTFLAWTTAPGRSELRASRSLRSCHRTTPSSRHWTSLRQIVRRSPSSGRPRLHVASSSWRCRFSESARRPSS
eukprot:5108420-Prymnesium_polylepis.1